MTVSAHSKPNYSFSRAERLTSKIKIEELFKKGSSFRLKKIQIILLSQQSRQDRKVLISVPKKNHKTAVKRNRIKRRLKAITSKILKIKGAINSNYTYIIICKIKSYSEKYDKIFLEMQKSFKKLN